MTPSERDRYMDRLDELRQAEPKADDADAERIADAIEAIYALFPAFRNVRHKPCQSKIKSPDATSSS